MTIDTGAHYIVFSHPHRSKEHISQLSDKFIAREEAYRELVKLVVRYPEATIWKCRHM